MENQEHTFKTFNQTIKEDGFKNVIFLYGEEEYLVDWAYKSLIKKYINPDTMDMDLVKLEEDYSIDDIIEASETISMFSNKRVIVAKDFPLLNQKNPKGFTNEKVAELIEYLQFQIDGCFLIFISKEVDEKLDFTKTLKNISQTFNFTKLDLQTLIGFSIKKFKECGYEPNKELVKYFLLETGYFNKESEYKIYNLTNDIIKVCNYSNGGEITREAIDNTLIGELDSYIFNFFDAIEQNKKNVAFQMLHTILEDEKDFYKLLGALISNFEFILICSQFRSDGMDLKKMMEKLNQGKDFRIKKAFRMADKYSEKELKNILSKLYEVDRHVKSGEMDGPLNLEIILSEM